MPDICHDFWIAAPAQQVFQAIVSPKVMAYWWTKRSFEPKNDTEYKLWFGPRYDWRGVVSRRVPNKEFELKLTKAHKDWAGTRVGFALKGSNGRTHVRFRHAGWRDSNEHYRISCFCWAMYLRLLKRYIEHGEIVPYEKRLNV